MAEIQQITATARDKTGRSQSRSLRQAGMVPGVIYGGDGKPLPVAVERRTLEKEERRHGFYARQYDMDLGGKTQRVLPWDVHHDPVTDVPIHIDFLRVTDKTKVTVAVDMIFTNEEQSPGLKRGGVLNLVRHQVEIVCAVGQMPQHLEADLSGLDIGDSVHISSISLPDGVKPLIKDRDFTIATIVPPTKMVVEESVVEGAEDEGVDEDEGQSQDGQSSSD